LIVDGELEFGRIHLALRPQDDDDLLNIVQIEVRRR
jgi:hypothetical protein